MWKAGSHATVELAIPRQVLASKQGKCWGIFFIVGVQSNKHFGIFALMIIQDDDWQ